jgi:proliferating cell nuclear antigen PCNA
MFKATLAETNLLRDSMISIAEIIDEGLFKVTKEGISFIAADRAMVSVVDFFIDVKAFEKYEVDAEQLIGLNIPNFLSVIKRAGTGDKLSFELKDAKLQVVIEGTSKRRFLLPLLDLGGEEIPPVNQLDFKSKVQLKSDVLQSGISDAEIIGDSVIIKSSPEGFWIIAEGDVSKAELEILEANEALMALASPEEFKSRYALDYLKKMVKGTAKLSDSVTIKHGQDYPMSIAFAAAEDKVKLSFILAPRVTED